MIPSFLRPEFLQFTSIEIVRATADLAPLPLVCSWCAPDRRTAVATLHASHGICDRCIEKLEAGATS